MPVELQRAGLKLSGTALFLDATRKAELSFVSHAHSDHIARHRRVIATAPTLALMQARLGALEAPLPAPYRRPFELGNLLLELFPAGHVLGSAQMRAVREDGRRVVYTGDLNHSRARTAEALEVAECDTLVLESTFGHPRYAFPPREEVLGELERWVRRQLEGGVTPVVYAYPLGKSQEAISYLEGAGLKVVAHPSVHAVCEVYRAHGVALSPRRFEGTVEPGEVAVFPPFGKSQALRQVRPRATAVLTGWAQDGAGARQRYRADVAFPLSDHADFKGLVDYALATGAEEVITLHGFADDLAEALRKKGVFARSVKRAVQLEMAFR